MHATLDSLFGILLVFLAISIAFSDIIQYSRMTVGAKVQDVAAVGGTVQRTVLTQLSDPTGQHLSPDKLLELSTVPGTPQPAPPHTNYTQFLNGLGIRGVGFKLDIQPQLSIHYNLTQSGLYMIVSRAFNGGPVSASIRVYIFNGTQVLSKLEGQASLEGRVFFQPSVPVGAVVLMFANAGSATTYNASSYTGAPLQDGPLYVYQNILEGDNYSPYVFAFEDWTGPLPTGGQVNVSGYSLPVLLVYQLPDGSFRTSPYPRSPSNYGTEPTLLVYSTELMVNVQIQGSIFTMHMKVWSTG